ncbi:MAG: phosphatase [Cyanothece sp. SIO1E1]|nr:phosphatase [Cyanothece sp. SIO1E1]
MARLAVLDLGTNTFHLLIVETDSASHFSVLYKEKRFVKLAEGGIERIGEGAMRRAMSTLKAYRTLLDQYQVKKVKVIGTAALRTASNGPDLMKWAADETQLDIEIISGEREASLIQKGVFQSLIDPIERYLVMDIGGGSVEFIIAERETIVWCQSFPVGAAVLLREFHQEDPISSEDLQAIKDFLSLQLGPLQKALQQWPTSWLVGAAGTFDIITEQIAINNSSPQTWEIDPTRFAPLFEELKGMSWEERERSPWIPDDRVDMIVVASSLIHYVLETYLIKRFTVSAYALKEGMIAEMLSEGLNSPE